MIFNYLSFSFPLVSSPSAPLSLSSPSLPKSQKTDAELKTNGFKQGDRLWVKAKLCALLNWAPPRLKPVVLNVLSKPVSCAVCEGLEGRREDIVENSRDSPHSRSDRLLQAQVWRGFD